VRQLIPRVVNGKKVQRMSAAEIVDRLRALLIELETANKEKKNQFNQQEQHQDQLT